MRRSVSCSDNHESWCLAEAGHIVEATVYDGKYEFPFTRDKNSLLEDNAHIEIDDKHWMP